MAARRLRVHRSTSCRPSKQMSRNAQGPGAQDGPIPDAPRRPPDPTDGQGPARRIHPLRTARAAIQVAQDFARRIHQPRVTLPRAEPPRRRKRLTKDGSKSQGDLPGNDQGSSSPSPSCSSDNLKEGLRRSQASSSRDGNAKGACETSDRNRSTSSGSKARALSPMSGSTCMSGDLLVSDVDDEDVQDRGSVLASAASRLELLGAAHTVGQGGSTQVASDQASLPQPSDGLGRTPALPQIASRPHSPSEASYQEQDDKWFIAESRNPLALAARLRLGSPRGIPPPPRRRHVLPKLDLPKGSHERAQPSSSGRGAQASSWSRTPRTDAAGSTSAHTPRDEAVQSAKSIADGSASAQPCGSTLIVVKPNPAQPDVGERSRPTLPRIPGPWFEGGCVCDTRRQSPDQTKGD